MVHLERESMKSIKFKEREGERLLLSLLPKKLGVIASIHFREHEHEHER